MQYYQDVSLSTQSKELQSILQSTFPTCTQFDIIGFSLGARIALSTIASFPSLIRKAHLTGVGIERSDYAKVVISSWKDMLQESGSSSVSSSSSLSSSSPSLRAFAWSIIIATKSKEILSTSGPNKIRSWVDHICETNNPRGLLSLLEQTHDDIIVVDGSGTTTNEMRQIANQIRSNNNDNTNKKEEDENSSSSSSSSTRTKGRIHIGEMDEIASLNYAQELNHLIGWYGDDDDDDDGVQNNDVVVYKGCNHAVMNENGVEWRRDALEYLNC